MLMNAMSDVTRILEQIEAGDPSAAEQLLPLVYDELRKLAAAKMAGESPDHTLQATALVHEAYLRLVDAKRQPQWDSRGHFFAAAAEAMRRILVESARRKASTKHGGEHERRVVDVDQLAAPNDAQDLLELDDALCRLAGVDAVAAQLVKLRYFAGLTVEQAAELLGMSHRSGYHTWNYARSWLRRAMRDD
jgi:RNA polymerase sigma factor (TIGR02999 family)